MANLEKGVQLIHYCHWSSQPAIRIKCLSWGGNSCGETDVPGVYNADFDDDLWSVSYTFDKDKVTCEECLEKMK